jgi:hypothetical protein
MAGALRHQPEKIQALHVGRVAREDLTANLSCFAGLALSVQPACFGCEIGNVGAYQTQVAALANPSRCRLPPARRSFRFISDLRTFGFASKRSRVPS